MEIYIYIYMETNKTKISVIIEKDDWGWNYAF